MGARSTLLPGTVVGKYAHVEAGSTVTGRKKIKDGQRWSGSPAQKVGRSKHRFPSHTPKRRPWWVAIYDATSVLLAIQPVVALAVGAALVLTLVHSTGGDGFIGAIFFAPVGALAAFATYMPVSYTHLRAHETN